MDPTPGFPAKEVLGVKDIASRDWSGRVWASLPLSQTVFFEGSDQTWVVGDVRFASLLCACPELTAEIAPKTLSVRRTVCRSWLAPRN